MPSTTEVLEAARRLVEDKLAELNEERCRLERALAELGGKAKRSPGRQCVGASKAGVKVSRGPNSAVAAAVAPASTRPSS